MALLAFQLKDFFMRNFSDDSDFFDQFEPSQDLEDWLDLDFPSDFGNLEDFDEPILNVE